MKKITNYKNLIGLRKPSWRTFYEKTFIKEQNKVSPDIEQLWTRNYYKSYVRLPIIHLKKPQVTKDTNIEQLLMTRSSQKDFISKPLDINKLSSVLYYSAGLKKFSENSRFYPSAGARYPLETYIISLNVKSLKKGIYHYYVKEHGLEYLTDISDINIQQSFKFPWVKDGGAIIVMTAVFNRTMMKYGDRGYNYIFIEAGHLCQNILLIASKYKIGACPLGGFFEEKLNTLLDIDKQFESTIYSVVVGNV